MKNNRYLPQGSCLVIVIGGISGFLLFLLLLWIPIQLNRAASPTDTAPNVALITALPAVPTTDTIPVTTEAPGEETNIPGDLSFVAWNYGDFVEVWGTEGEGLRLRNSAGLNSVISMVAVENEVFELRGGPTELDGYNWWFLVNPYDSSQQGWAAQDFLRSINNPSP
jgi:hypothetical protein